MAKEDNHFTYAMIESNLKDWIIKSETSSARSFTLGAQKVTVTRPINHGRGDNLLAGEGFQKVTVTLRVNHAGGKYLLRALLSPE